ncbi:hypothetical protein PVL29_021164 [Vitis rotundifolia]|uniref:Cytochrome P450 704C1-like n=1 Tax=Vitis rotundifolia TaxID=103349 RepID=A0AA38YZ51_VITRO|nr:hypothetical protein PVL29_021164 [Vitis rotundifolia]
MNFMLFFFHPINLAGTALAVILSISIIKIFAGRLAEKKRRYHPIAGTVLHQLANFPSLHHYMTDLGGKHRTYRLLSFLRSEVYTTDPINVEYILKTNFPNYARGWYHHTVLEDFLGDGIFAVDGDLWRQQRKLSCYEFSTKMLKDFSSGIFRSNAAKLAGGLFMKSMLDSVFKVVLGVELDSICGTNQESTKFSNSLDESSELTFYHYVDLFWKAKRFLNVGSEAKLRNSIKVVDQYVNKVIQSKIEEIHKLQEVSVPMKKGDVLSRFLELRKTDPKYLKDIILSFIIAGKDTTALTLSWFLYMLCKHPPIQEKIAQEVKEATKAKDASTLDELAASITEESLDKMQYLHAALTETLRLYPPVPVDGKLCLSDDTWPDGFSVRKGDLVAYQPYAMGRMAFLWGTEAEDFRPARWLDENGIFCPESPFKFTAFQAGPRVCLGKDFAYRQMKIFSAILLSSFTFKLSDENKAVNYRTMINLLINGGLHIHASHRLGYGKLLVA